MQSLIASSPATLYLYTRLNAAKTRYDAWWFVLAAVVLALAATIYLGLTVWCIYKGHVGFTGNFRWIKVGFSMSAQCIR